MTSKEVYKTAYIFYAKRNIFREKILKVILFDIIFRLITRSVTHNI